MPEAKELGPLFVHSVRLKKGTPLAHRASTQELEEPFRLSPRSLVLRYWPTTYGTVIGRWKDSGYSEEQAFFAGLDGYEADPLDSEGRLLDAYDLD